MAYTMRTRRRIKYNLIAPTECTTIDVVNPYTGYEEHTKIDSSKLSTNILMEECTDVDRKVHPRRKDSLDDGGPFFLKKLEIKSSSTSWSGGVNYNFSNYDTKYRAKGQAYPSSPGTDQLLLLNQDQLNLKWDFTFPSGDLSSYGAEAFKKLDPTRVKGVPQLAQSIIEVLREGIPRVPGMAFSQLRSARNAGKEYLNASFGWGPLLNDLKAIVGTYKNIQPLLAQLRKDSGQNVRRSGTLFKETVSGDRAPYGLVLSPVLGGGNNGSIAVGDPDALSAESWTTTSTRVWFAGKGSYILPSALQEPNMSDIAGFLAIQNELLSPVLVWELLPWSWLVDYFTNIGDIIENAMGHGIGIYTANYCYLMREHIVRTTYSGNRIGRAGFADPWGNVSYITGSTGSIEVIQTTKERVAASPFGFGLSQESLSTSQWAILAALGLSRQNFL